MKPALLATIIAGALLAVSTLGIAFSLGGPATDGAGGFFGAGADEDRVAHGQAGDHDHEALGMERPAFPEAEGSTPTAQDAEDLEQVSRIQIRSDDEATPAEGIRSGSGTLEDPYVISDYYVTGDLYISDTDACFLIKENYIGGQLSLNWNGQCVHVHHNHIADLRVNENIMRTGFATGGLLELNKIEYVGQLRHYDGEFRHNIVGPRQSTSMFDEVLETVPYLFAEDPRVANVDGFNQGLIHHNTFHGSVDLDLHGHHHGTGFFAPHSHYHGSNDTKGMAHDHTDRWTSVAFTDNKIVDPEGYGLRYEDRNHRGDDRTANSEDEETLDEDHRHHTHITIARNVLKGSPIWVDIFNADDERHYTRNPGTLEVVDNQVTLHERKADGPAGLPFFGPGFHYNAALSVFTAKEVDLKVTGNQLAFVAQEADEDRLDLWPFDDEDQAEAIGIRLDRVKDANVTVAGNTMEAFHYGVWAKELDEKTAWVVSDNHFGDAAYDVYWDDSVENRPQGSDV